MSITVRPHSGSSSRKLLGGSAILGAAVVTLAACGSSAGTSASGSGSGSSPSAAAGSSSVSASTGAAGTSASAVTISTRNVPGVGTVLVDGEGRTLYMFTTEKGGKITCTASSGCLHAWPETDLPGGATTATAGHGVQSSLLGTVQGATGKTEVTYNGWPLYTFIGDSAAGQAKGQALTNFGGTWYVLNAAGDPVTGKAAAGGGSSPTGGSGGYGY